MVPLMPLMVPLMPRWSATYDCFFSAAHNPAFPPNIYVMAAMLTPWLAAMGCRAHTLCAVL